MFKTRTSRAAGLYRGDKYSDAGGKAGDSDLRTLLILGARATLAAAARKKDRLSRWAVALSERRGYWKAVVAVAAKNARMAWAMLAKGEEFKPMT